MRYDRVHSPATSPGAWNAMTDTATPQVRSTREGAVAVLTITHPPVNAISGAVAAGILQGLAEAEADPEVRALVLTGDGQRFFSAGADVTEFGGGDIAGARDLTRRLETSRLPVVAAVNGIAFGGGCELALACDLRVCAEGARFGQPEIKLGIIPGWGGTQRLPRLVGRGAAMEILLSGDPVDAQRALSLGLVNRVVPAERLMEEALGLAATLAARAPLAAAAIKRAVDRGLDGTLEEGLRAEGEAFATILPSEDAIEGISAFLQKRTPAWRGR
jgi:enoyl-CoA hydratase